MAPLSDSSLELEHSDVLGKRNILLVFSLGLPLTILNFWERFFGTLTAEAVVVSAIVGGVGVWMVREKYDKRLKEIREELGYIEPKFDTSLR